MVVLWVLFMDIGNNAHFHGIFTTLRLIHFSWAFHGYFIVNYPWNVYRKIMNKNQNSYSMKCKVFTVTDL